MTLLAWSYTPQYFARIEITNGVHFCTQLGRIAGGVEQKLLPG